jgi:hypothetical protein
VPKKVNFKTLEELDKENLAGHDENLLISDWEKLEHK